MKSMRVRSQLTWIAAFCLFTNLFAADKLAPPAADQPVIIQHEVVELPPPQVSSGMHEVVAGVPLSVPDIATYWDGWNGGFDFGINGTEGNSKNLNLRFQGDGEKENELGLTKWNFLYSLATAGSVRTTNRAILNARQEWKLKDPNYAIYNTWQLEFDEFRAFDFRLAAFLGLSRTFIKNDATLFKGRFGAGASREFGGPNDDWVPELNIGWDFDHKISDRQKFKSSVDIFPDISDFGEYRAQANLAYELLIDPSRNMYLKLGLVDRYDSTPEGRKANDVEYFAALSWKYGAKSKIDAANANRECP